jgi:polyisoprenyl-phosphate glycosyltransferase
MTPTDRAAQGAPVELSVVVPVYDEAEALPVFLAAVLPVLEGMDLDGFELVVVDDGSSDGTWELLQSLDVPALRRVRLSRNFGKEAALTAGLDLSRGDAVVVMDVDLQDPPELLPEFVRLWRDDWDVVYGARADRGSDSPAKRLTSRAFYRTFNALSSSPIPADAGDYRLMDRAVVEAVKAMPERSRFMKGVLAWPGFRTTSVPYVRPARAAGTTKWRYRRLWSFALDGLFNFSSAPLRVWSYLGLVTMLLGFGFLALVLITAAAGQRTPSGYVSLLGVVVGLSGVQILGLGMIGEYLSRVFTEVKARPVYVVSEGDGIPRRTRRQPTGTAGFAAVRTDREDARGPA